MSDLKDDNKKTLISFKATGERQELNEDKIKFKYATKERQRKLNMGKSIDPEQQKENYHPSHQLRIFFLLKYQPATARKLVVYNNRIKPLFPIACRFSIDPLTVVPFIPLT